MRLINNKVELIEQENSLEGVYKQIERAGRTCYKSEDKITEDSAKGFVERMIASKHTAMLEHGTVYLKLSKEEADKVSDLMFTLTLDPYTITTHDENTRYITTNYRVIVENELEYLLKYICEPTERHIKRITLKITTDRGVSHELVRHRKFSFAQESTRYCNYLNKGLTFIIPSWWEDELEEGDYAYWDRDWVVDLQKIVRNADEHDAINLFLWGIKNDEDYYKQMVNIFKLKPQQARQMLSNALKTEIIMTGFESDWEYFLDLRYKETTGKVHPDMKSVATKINDIINGNQNT